MPDPKLLLIVVVAWIVVILLGRRFVLRQLAEGPLLDPVLGILWRLARILCCLFHRARWEGLEHVPPTTDPGGLVVVGNHTSGVDPLLIQSACRFHIRWMVAAEMMRPSLDDFWRIFRSIPVSRDGSDATPLRTALRHVRQGGVLGLFPEGGIVRPPGEIRPFLEGAGLIVARTGSPVLLVWIHGTPAHREAMASVFTPSRARVRFVDRIEFPAGTDPSTITEALRRRLVEVSGWPVNDAPMPIPPGPEEPWSP